MNNFYALAPAPAIRQEPLDLLASCEDILLLEHTPFRGALLIGGADGCFVVGEHGFCVGIALDIQDPPHIWLYQTTLWFASMIEASDDAISLVDGRWHIWRRYEKDISSAELHESAHKLLALARYLSESCTDSDTCGAHSSGPVRV